MFTAGACGSGLANSLELPNDDFLLEGDNNDSASCTVGVRDVVSTANLEFPDGESPEFFESGIFADVFRWRVLGFEESTAAFSCEGVTGSEICRKEFRLSCSGEHGAERLTRGAGKERELDELSSRAWGDIGRAKGRGLSEENDLLPEGGLSSF